MNKCQFLKSLKQPNGTMGQSRDTSEVKPSGPPARRGSELLPSQVQIPGEAK